MSLGTREPIALWRKLLRESSRLPTPEEVLSPRETLGLWAMAGGALIIAFGALVVVAIS